MRVCLYTRGRVEESDAASDPYLTRVSSDTGAREWVVVDVVVY
jgi:hypothetical protein